MMNERGWKGRGMLIASLLASAVLSSGCNSRGGESDESDASVPDAGSVEPDAGPCRTPTKLIFESDMGGKASIGYTGAAHNILQPLHAKFVVGIDECDDACENCSFSGPIEADENLWRCDTETSQVCSSDTDDCRKYACVPNPALPSRLCVGTATVTCETADDCDNAACTGKTCFGTLDPCETEDDCKNGKCRYFYGAQTGASNIGGPSANALAFVAEDPEDPSNPHDPENPVPPIQGSINVLSGRTTFARVRLWSFSNAGIGYPDTCDGDPNSNDGVKDGTCSGDGAPCDVQTESRFDGMTGTFSLDCPLNLAPVVRIPIENLSSETPAAWTLNVDDQPVCDGDESPCWCGTCKGDPDQPCHSHSDCSPGDECMDGTPNNRCTGRCDTVPGEVPGTCTIGQEQGTCLPSGEGASMSLRGSAGLGEEPNTFKVGVVAFSCVGRSKLSVLNTNIGFPGPLVVEQRFRVEVRYE